MPQRDTSALGLSPDFETEHTAVVLIDVFFSSDLSRGATRSGRITWTSCLSGSFCLFLGTRDDDVDTQIRPMPSTS